MINKFLAISFILMLIVSSSNDDLVTSLVKENFNLAQKQLSLMLRAVGDSEQNPRSINQDGSLLFVPSRDWTSGFFPGCLWFMFEFTKDVKWKKSAQKFTKNIEEEQYNGRTHDMGFKMYCSFGNGYRLTHDEQYKKVLLESAKTLITRFNPKVGCIRSWDHHKEVWQFPVIIDNMMNLELLFWATKVSGDSTFYKVAVTHANTTLKNHFRDDYSTWHVLNYDTTTGEVLDRHTHQGFAHESCWSRGQAWALYGFTLCYRETHDKQYLAQAQKIADFILNHKNLPQDLVPYWDFDAPNIPNEERDASAGAIIDAALYELSTYLENKGEKYKKAADKMLKTLSSSRYRAKEGENNNFILMHSVGHKPGKVEIDVPTIFADYYFLEANLRKLKIKKDIILTKIEDQYSKLIYPGNNGKLVYFPDENGNTILNFSNCGYMGGGVKLPDFDVKVTLEPAEGDDGTRIQTAITEVAKLPLDENSFRGAVLLKRGQYDISGSLRISASGVVLRGEGQDENGTILYATGTTRRSLIIVDGTDNRIEMAGTSREIIDEYVPVGARSFHVKTEGVFPYDVGDKVIVRRIGNAAWIHEIGMDRITPRPDDPLDTKQWEPFDLDYDRIITKIEGNFITVDAPIACAIERRWGGGRLIKYTDSKRISQVGIENLLGKSYFNKGETDSEDGERYYSDEDHCRTFIRIDNAKNVWVKNVTARHFIDNCVQIDKGAKWITVQDCSNLEMVSKIRGGRRGAFQINGQLCLVQRCHAETGRHDYSVSSRVCGPNVFLYSDAIKSYGNSEAHHRWSTGGLFDNVKANLRIEDRQYLGSGHGWAGANYVFWNCEGSLVCQKPPTAQNYAIGHIGEAAEPNFPGREKGYWESHRRHVMPASLYLKQLEDRLGPESLTNIGYQP